MDLDHLAAGVDLVSVHRIARLLAEHGERFERRVFTPQERADCNGRADSLAARWAAKEAVAKALGTGFGPISFLDIEIVRDEAGCPQVRLHGAAAARAHNRGLRRWALSLSHDGGLAIAFVIASS